MASGKRRAPKRGKAGKSKGAALKSAVEKALAKVIDPETGLSLPRMGLIKEISVKGSEAHIKMTLTTPHCPLAQYLVEQVRQAASSVKGVKKAEVELVF